MLVNKEFLQLMAKDRKLAKANQPTKLKYFKLLRTVQNKLKSVKSSRNLQNCEFLASNERPNTTRREQLAYERLL